jgi:hypothetical protein
MDCEPQLKVESVMVQIVQHRCTNTRCSKACLHGCCIAVLSLWLRRPAVSEWLLVFASHHAVPHALTPAGAATSIQTGTLLCFTSYSNSSVGAPASFQRCFAAAKNKTDKLADLQRLKPRYLGSEASEQARYVSLKDMPAAAPSNKWKQSTVEALNFHLDAEGYAQFFHPDANLFSFLHPTAPKEPTTEDVRELRAKGHN